MAFEQQPESLRQKVQQWSDEAIAQSDPTAWFERLYIAADGNTDQVPWARLDVHPHIQDWLSQHGGRGEGRAALVIGCGLGDDAEALAALGFAVTAFDIAPTAIAWCQKRFPESPVTYLVADLFKPQAAWLQRFDLVVECRDIQALPLTVRSEAIAAVASVVAPAGTLLVVTRLRATEAEPDGPPWPLSEQELAQFGAAGLQERQRQVFDLGGDPMIHQAWVEYAATG